MESLGDIQVGEVVVVRDRNRREIAKVNKLHFLLEKRDTKFRKIDGLEAGRDAWSRDVVGRPKPGEIEEINAEVRARNARYFVEKHIESIRHTPAAFVPIAKFIKEDMKCSDETS